MCPAVSSRPSRFGLIVLLLAAHASIAGAASRTLTFEERVAAQKAIDRIYYSHQIGTTKSFDEAVPRSVLEKKVRTYLKQSVALERFWKTPVTADALWAEMKRVARSTRVPDRLQEVFDALGNDPFLIQECLARATLADRLSHNFFSFDARMHATARHEAEELRGQLLEGSLPVMAPHPLRREIHVTHGRPPDVERPYSGPEYTLKEVTSGDRESIVGQEGFARWRTRVPRRPGEIGPVQEERDAYVLRVLLDGEQASLDIAEYTVAKTDWDAWWTSVEAGLDEMSVRPIATPQSELTPLRLPATQAWAGVVSDHGPGGIQGISQSCAPDDTWENGSLDDVPAPRSSHTAVWTGSVMVVWGGFSNTGGRYDPTTDSWSPTSTVNAPPARGYHTAVWTGSVMVIWGGYGSDGYDTSTGGRYDPVGDTWTATSGVNAPSPREGHTAAWTGSKMIVWGGSAHDVTTNSTIHLDSGGQYNPVKDTWAATSTLNAPSPRQGHSAVWTGSSMIIWGGSGSLYPFAERTGGRYDPVSNTWKPTSTVNAPDRRARHTSIWTGSEMVTWGGDDDGYNPNSGGRYDPLSDRWAPMSTAGAPPGRSFHTAVWTGRVLVVWGGENAMYGFEMGTGGRYDPVTDTWESTSLLNASPRSRHTAVWTGSLMLAWGGFSDNAGGRYDPATNAWTPISTANAPSGRRWNTTLWTGSVMLVWGGYDISSGKSLRTGSRYDPVTDTWTRTSMVHAPSGRWSHSAVWTGDQMVAWGGAEGYYFSEYSQQELNTGGRYDPFSNTWTPTSTVNAPSGRAAHSAVWTGSVMVIWGGYGSDGYYTSTGGRYDPVADTWSPTSTQNAPSPVGTAIWADSVMITWNGATGGRYDPGSDTWTPISTANAPSLKDYFTTVWTGRMMVVWGGFGLTGYNGDYRGGRYDPATDTWTLTSIVDAPSGRAGHTAVWTGHEMLVWGGSESIFGGELGTGGRYDPLTDLWTPTSTVHAPSARSFHSAVWTGSGMLVWGGQVGGGLATVGGGFYAADQARDDDSDGFARCAADCDDTNPNVHPGAKEVCDALDNDCDGAVDDMPGGCGSLSVTSPSEGGVVDCNATSIPPVIVWNGPAYERFRVFASGDPGFTEAKRISSGGTLLRTTSWRPPLNLWRRVCHRAGPNLFIRVHGIDLDLPKSDSGYSFTSPNVTVRIQK